MTTKNQTPDTKVLAAALAADPWAELQAQAGAVEVRINTKSGAKLPTKSEVVRSGWPYRDHKPVKAKPSNWPF